MHLSRPVARLLGWAIALFAISGALGTLRDGFHDVYDQGDCGGTEPAPTGDCATRRLLWAGAEAGVLLLRTPAIAFLALAIFVFILDRRSEKAVARGDVAAGS